jgi:hypothetical protein
VSEPVGERTPAAERPSPARLRRSLVSVVLIFEALVLFFAGLVARGESTLGPGTAIGLASGLAVLCLLACGVLGRPWGLYAGVVLQVAVIGFGYWVHEMYFLGAVFAALYVACIVTADRAVAARARLEAAMARQAADRQAANGASGADDTGG